jgi:glycosyltransferase involved in cell wall biosynthesis
MDISILISTRNNARRLKETLLHISHCRIPRGISWEVVVVNHNSQDHTEQVARELQKVLPLKYSVESREGLGQARNCGLRTSSGALVIFTDDDVEPDPGWVEAYWSAYIANPTKRFWGGPIESEFEGAEPNWELVQLGPPSVKGLDLGERERRLFGQGVLLIAANWGCPSAALKREGGFDSQLGLNTAIGLGEETDLMERLVQAGMEPWYVPSAKLRHTVPTAKVSLKNLGNRRRAFGRYEVRNASNLRTSNVPLLGVPAWVVRKLLETSVAWIFARMTGKSGFAEYLDLQGTLGVAEALRTRGKRTAKKAFVRNE